MIHYFGRNGLILLTKNALLKKVPKSLGRAPHPIWAMPEKMHFFSQENVPYLSQHSQLHNTWAWRCFWGSGTSVSDKGLTDFFFKSIMWYQHKGWCPGVRQGLKDINLKSLIIIQYKFQVGKDGEASTDPEDWGECHSDCPLRGYRDNQVKISNFLPTDNVISICFDHMIT